MIITTTYFKGDIYLPQAKPNMLEENGVQDDVIFFINENSEECVLRCLGLNLFNSFSEQLDSLKENGLKDDVDEKWDFLLNGKKYTDSKGVDKKWRGIRFKQIGSQDYVSFIAYYVFYKYQFYLQSQTTSTGQKKVKSENSEFADASPLISRSWNKFVNFVQFELKQPKIIESSYGLGLDYFTENKNQFTTLNEYIKDQNEIIPNYYEGYNPEVFFKTNSMGI